MEGIGEFIDPCSISPDAPGYNLPTQLHNTSNTIGWHGKDRSGLRGPKAGVDDGNAVYGPERCMAAKGRTRRRSAAKVERGEGN